jgi:hypothetical protein
LVLPRRAAPWVAGPRRPSPRASALTPPTPRRCPMTSASIPCIRIREPGGPDVLELTTVELPALGPTEVRVRVAASGLNRADLLERRGGYAPPPGAPPRIPGLEYAGVVDAVGEGCTLRRVGDRVMGLVGGRRVCRSPPGRRTRDDPGARRDGDRRGCGPPRSADDRVGRGLPAGWAGRRGNAPGARGGKRRGHRRPSARTLGRRPGRRYLAHLGQARSGPSPSASNRRWPSTPRSTGGPRRVREATGGAGVDVVLDLVGGATRPIPSRRWRPGLAGSSWASPRGARRSSTCAASWGCGPWCAERCSGPGPPRKRRGWPADSRSGSCPGSSPGRSGPSSNGSSPPRGGRSAPAPRVEPDLRKGAPRWEDRLTFAQRGPMRQTPRHHPSIPSASRTILACFASCALARPSAVEARSGRETGRIGISRGTAARASARRRSPPPCSAVPPEPRSPRTASGTWRRGPRGPRGERVQLLDPGDRHVGRAPPALVP